MKKTKKVYVIEVRYPIRQIVVLESSREVKDMIRYCQMNEWSFLVYTQII